MNEFEKLEFEAFKKCMLSNYTSPKKSVEQVISLINSGTGKMLFKVWNLAKSHGAPAGMNHYCQGESGKGEWSIRSEEVPSICFYCKQPNDALISKNRGIGSTELNCSSIDLNDRGSLEKSLCGALKSSIEAHGDITCMNVHSASKRIIGAIKQWNKQQIAKSLT